MKKIVFMTFAGLLCVLLTACDNKKSSKETAMPDVSGTYICTFSVSPTGMNVYNYKETVTISVESGAIKLTAPEPLQNTTITYNSTTGQFLLYVPNTVFTFNNKQCYLSLQATLEYNNGSFITKAGSMSFGEYGVSGDVYGVSDFKLTRK